MYTIIVNDDLSLTTTIRSVLLRNNPINELQVLMVADDYLPGEIEYLAKLCYEKDGVIHTVDFTTDTEFYKERVRFHISSSSAFFSNRGIMECWLEITRNEVDDDVIMSTTSFNTLPTTIMIEDNSKITPPCDKKERNTIMITRGDSLSISVTLTDNDGYPYEPTLGDVVYFRVKKSATTSEILIEKQIDINTLVIELVEADTKNLAFGNYKYEIEVVTVNDDHYTVIKNAPFIITEELH